MALISTNSRPSDDLTHILDIFPVTVLADAEEQTRLAIHEQEDQLMYVHGAKLRMEEINSRLTLNFNLISRDSYEFSLSTGLRLCMDCK